MLVIKLIFLTILNESYEVKLVNRSESGIKQNYVIKCESIPLNHAKAPANLLPEHH